MHGLRLRSQEDHARSVVSHSPSGLLVRSLLAVFVVLPIVAMMLISIAVLRLCT